MFPHAKVSRSSCCKLNNGGASREEADFFAGLVQTTPAQADKIESGIIQLNQYPIQLNCLGPFVTLSVSFCRMSGTSPLLRRAEVLSFIVAVSASYALEAVRTCRSHLFVGSLGMCFG
eukprot:3820248-Amphidinium_carterae.1